MWRSHSADYGSRFRSDSATKRKAKTSDYYPQWSGVFYYCLNAVVYVRYRVLRIGNGLGRSAKHSRQLGASRNIRETQPILSSRITIVASSWQILLYRIKIVPMSCQSLTYIQDCYCCPWYNHSRLNFAKSLIKITWNGFLTDVFRQRRFTVWSLIGSHSEDAVGPNSVVFYHTNRIKIRLRTG